MKKLKFSESKIVSILKDGEADRPVEQTLIKHWISQAACYDRKSKYDGATVRLNELEVERAKLERMYADLALGREAIKEVLNRKL